MAHLRRLMRQVVDDSEDARRRGEAAREHIATNFNRERVAGMVKARLQEVLDGLNR